MKSSLFLSPLAAAAILATAGVAAEPRPAAPPTPEQWWKPAPPLEEAADPLGGRGINRGETWPKVPTAFEASYYRLWGLYPIQAQVVRRGESVIELWIRPQSGGREVVIRATSRQDGRVFVQARAGHGCCAPGVLKRVDIDAEIAADASAPLRRLADSPLWAEPENVVIDEGDGAVTALCVGGASYDLYLLERSRAVHLRRDCGDVEVGAAAPLIAPLVRAAWGRDARFDDVFPKGPDFDQERRAHAQLLAGGGSMLKE